MKRYKVFQNIKNTYKKGLYIVLALLVTLSIAPSVFAMQTFNTYSISSSYYNPNKIISSDGSLWYLESNSGTGINDYTHIGKMTTSGVVTNYNILALTGKSSLRLRSITQGPDGNVWFVGGTGGGSACAGFIDVSTGAVTTYSGPGSVPTYASVGQIVTGSDGNLWYPVKSANDQYTYILKLVPSTGITTVQGSYDTYTNITDMTSLPGGSIWATDAYYNRINIIPMTGSIGGSYTMLNGSASNHPADIVAGSDGNLWISTTGGKILKMTPAGVFTEYTPPSMASNLTVGYDGAIWFTYGGNNIGHITSSGVIKGYTVSGISSVSSMTLGSDGALWLTVTTSSGSKIGRFSVQPTPQTIAFTSMAPADAIIDGPVYIPTATATSGLPVAITIDSSSLSVCSIQNGVVSFQQAGTCTLNANQGGDDDYAAAPQVQQSFTVSPVDADTSVSLNCPATATIGTIVTCTITVANDGPAVAKDVSLTALFSSTFSNISLTGGGTVSGQSITWSAPSLASGASVTITFSATASTASRAYFNAALLQTSPDPDSSNNIAAATIVVS